MEKGPRTSFPPEPLESGLWGASVGGAVGLTMGWCDGCHFLRSLRVLPGGGGKMITMIEDLVSISENSNYPEMVGYKSTKSAFTGGIAQ